MRPFWRRRQIPAAPEHQADDVYIDRLHRLLDRLQAQAIVAAPHPTRDRLLDAVRWALGETGEFRDRHGHESDVYWRDELRRRAGL